MVVVEYNNELYFIEPQNLIPRNGTQINDDYLQKMIDEGKTRELIEWFLYSITHTHNIK